MVRDREERLNQYDHTGKSRDPRFIISFGSEGCKPHPRLPHVLRLVEIKKKKKKSENKCLFRQKLWVC